ncbi:MAG: prolipoprotein diacylglyceryl transferase [Clostridia bacterium]|nr:prolipoprotein diacylglyceryl transferase [Clostridia bacterium]
MNPVLWERPESSVAFEIESLGITVQWYAVLMALGIVIAVVLGCIEVKRRKLHPDTMYDLVFFTVPLGLIGARLYYVAFNFAQYAADPLSILYIWEGGLAIYGAIIGGLLGALIYSRIKNVRFLKLADLIAPGLVLAQAIGRWGNFFNQEAFGPAVENLDHAWFPLAVKIDVQHYLTLADGSKVLCTNPYHYATFFYESMWCLGIFLFLWFFLRKRRKHDGDLFFMYAMLYAFERMIVEGLRSDSLYLFGIRISQLLSAVIFFGLLAFFIVRAVKEKQLGRLILPSPMPDFAEPVPDGAPEPQPDAVRADEPAEDGDPDATEVVDDETANDGCNDDNADTEPTQEGTDEE